MNHASATNHVFDNRNALPTAQAAHRLGVTAKTLANWRACGEGPRFVRYGSPGGRVVYRPADLDNFLAEHVVH